MMKKLLVLVAILGMASLANAGIVNVLTDGVGSSGHAGTAADKLVAGETIQIKIQLARNPYPGYTSYDGYVIDVMEVDLNSAGGTLSVKQKLSGKVYVDDLGENAKWDLKGYTKSANNLDLKYASLTQVQSAGAPADLIWNVIVTVPAAPTGNVTLDLALDGIVHVGADWWPGQGKPSAGWFNAANSDLGDLTLYVVPEPMTMVLLGLGGLLLRRKK